MEQPNSYDLPRIRESTFVHEVDFHWELASTNCHALQRAEDPACATPLLVLAESQTAGRGRGSNRWSSAAGAMTFSLLVPLDEIPQDRVPQISLTVGLAVCQAVEQFVPHADLGIKWPNDIYMEQAKLAGILIELPRGRPRRAVLGIGVNVNNAISATDPTLARQAISLREAVQMEFDRTELLISCLQQLERRLEDLRQNPRQLVDQWRAYDFLRGRQIQLDTYGRVVAGRCHGIDEDGALVLESPDGSQRCLGGTIICFE